MQPIQRILIGLDLHPLTPENPLLTEGSQAALDQGRWLADRWGAKVELLCSTHGRPDLEAAGADQLAERLRDSLRETQPSIVGGELPDLCIRADEPWRALIERKSESDADLVLAGKRNQSRRADRRLGSVAVKLISKCPGPVWVVKPGQGADLPKVLSATDLSPVGDLAVEYGAALASLAGTQGGELCVVHAWQVPFALQWNAEHLGHGEATDRMQAIVQSASDAIRKVPGVAALAERCTVLTANASPDYTILQAADRVHPNLVVLGVTPRRGLANFILGNTAEKILSKLDCSLLTVKPSGADLGSS